MSNDKKKLTKAEALKALVTDLEAERLQEEAESMTKEEITEAEKAAGAHEALNDAFANIHKMIDEAKVEEVKPVKSNVVDIRTRLRRARPYAITAGVAWAAMAAGIALWMSREGLTVAREVDLHPTLPVGAIPPAEEAFNEAARDCALGRYQACLDGLHHAYSLDPDIVHELDYPVLLEKAKREVEKK